MGLIFVDKRKFYNLVILFDYTIIDLRDKHLKHIVSSESYLIFKENWTIIKKLICLQKEKIKY
jgi:hypothetical protein